MKTFFSSFIFILITAATLSAQNKFVTLEGVVADSTGGLTSASVTLMQPQDSVMVAFAFTDATGKYSLKRIPAGQYLLQATYLGYQAYYQAITVKPDAPKMDLGTVTLQPSSTLLGQVDISADRAPLTIRKDTIEYNAAAFKTQPGSVVEDLLKKLPGVQVDNNGNVRAQGEQVRNVLVDGKEFFGNDPKIATKNLPADAVDKVQVYDKKSEKAEFTGIEDGRDEKTINLKLKEDKKKGYFGSASAGYGTSQRYESKFNVNRFGKKLRMSAIGMGNNNIQQGFSFEDYIQFMGGLSNFMSGGGGRVRISFDTDESGIPMGYGLNNGFTRTWAGGANLNYDWGKKTSLVGSYFYSNLQNELERRATRENQLGTSRFLSTENEDRLTRTAGHNVNFTLRHNIDSMQNIIFKSRFNLTDALYDSYSTTQTFDTLQQLQNEGLRDYLTNGNKIQGNGSLVYRRKFGRKGRSLVADLSYQSGNESRNGDLAATNTFLNSPLGSQQIKQRQVYDDSPSNYSASVSYTEPVGRKQYLEWQVSRQEYANNPVKSFYDIQDTPTPGEVYNPLLSSKFRRGYEYNRMGMNYTVNRGNTNLTMGVAGQQSILDGVQLEPNLPPVYQKFERLLPSAFFNYEPKMGRNFSAEYTTSLREPSLEQLQPVVNNSDPLNLYVGNPDLKPEYVHDLNMHFMRFDQFTMTSFFVSLGGNYTLDRITNASTVDSLFRRTLTPVNVDWDYGANTYIGFSTPLRFIKTNMNINLCAAYNKGILFVNDVEDKTDRWNNSLELSFDNRKKEKFDLNVGTRFSWNSTVYAVSKDFNQSFLNQRYFGDLSVFPTKKWVVSTGLDYAIYSKETFGESQHVPLWKAGITRYVLKNNRGQLKLTAFDLLNRNLGINRTSQLNYILDERITNLGRYVMLSFAYSLSGFNNNAGGGGFQISIRH